MKQNVVRSSLVSCGFSLFSLFLGAATFVLPILLGQGFGSSSIFSALLGLLVTAVVIPFLGLYGMALYEGDYRAFFARTGKSVGFCFLVLLMVFIGPCGALCRCSILMKDALCDLFPRGPIHFLLLFACLGIFVVSMHKALIVDILGKLIAPLLSAFLLVLLIFGLLGPQVTSTHVPQFQTNPFRFGIHAGNQAISFLGALFFCHFIVNRLKKNSVVGQQLNHQELVRNSLFACFFGAGILSLAYIGIVYLSSKYPFFIESAPYHVLESLSYYVLGGIGGKVSRVLEILAYFSASVAFTAVFSEYIHRDISKGSLSYVRSLILTLVITYLCSFFEYLGVFYFLAPCVHLLYPALIMLTLLNIATKKLNFKISTTETCIVLVSSVLLYYLNSRCIF